jgi:hypothetical protein
LFSQNLIFTKYDKSDDQIMKFGTAINCMDGRVQLPVLEYLKKNFDLDFIDTANEAGPLKILTERTDKCRLLSLKERITFSVDARDSRIIAVAGHHDCLGNPAPREKQQDQIGQVLEYLRKAYGEHILYLGLYVNDRWEVEEVARLEP